MAKHTAAERRKRCNVCGCVAGCQLANSCDIKGRIYVNTAGQVVGVSPPCPTIPDDRAQFDLVEAFWLNGWIVEGGVLTMNQEEGEKRVAVQFATVLGVYGQDLRSTGLWENGRIAQNIVGRDDFRDACRSYSVPDVHEDGE